MNAKLLPLIALASLSACAAQEPQEARAFAEALPTAAELEMSVSEAAPSARTAGDLDPFYSLTRDVSGSVNGFVGGWLDLIHDITQGPAQSGGEGVFYWGPFHQGEGGLAPTTEYFRASRHPDGGYVYQLLEATRADEEDPSAYRVLVEGYILIDGAEPAERRILTNNENITGLSILTNNENITGLSLTNNENITEWNALVRDAGVEGGYGYFGVDFDTAAELDPGRSTEGLAVFGYDFTGLSTAELGGGDLVVAVMDGVGDLGADRPEYAIYGYVRQPGGAGVMDLYAESDIGASAATEVWDLRSRWTADGEGRTDGQATGGDLEETVLTLSDCWEGYTTIFYEDDLGAEATYGDEAACAFAEPSLPAGELPAWLLGALGG